MAIDRRRARRDYRLNAPLDAVPMFRRLACLMAAVALVHAAAAPLRAGDLGYSDVNPQDIRMPFLFGQPAETVKRAEAAIAGLRPTDDTTVMRRIGEVLTWLCEARAALRQYLEAEAACLDAVATLEKAARIDGIPESFSYELTTFALPQLAATYSEMGQHEAALSVRERQLALLAGKAGRESEKIGALSEIGGLQLVLGRFDAAEAAYLEAVAADSGAAEIDLGPLAQSYFGLAELYLLREQFAEAEATLLEGRTKAGEARTSSPSDADVTLQGFILQRFSNLLGWTYFHQNRLDDARDLGTALLEEYRNGGQGWSWSASDLLVLLGRVEDAAQPGSPEAERHLTSAVNHAGGGGGLPNTYRALAQSALARHHLLAGNPVAAATYAQVSVSALDGWLGSDHYETARARIVFARILQSQAKLDEARANAQTAYAALRAYLPPYHSDLGDTLALLAGLYEATGDRENLAAVEALRAEHAAARATFEAEN